METKRFNARLSPATIGKMDWLKATKGYASLTAVIETAVDRMFVQEGGTMTTKYESIHLYEDNAGTLFVVGKDANGPAKGWVINDPIGDAPAGFVADARDLLRGGASSWSVDTLEEDALFDTLETLNQTNSLSYLAIYDARGLHCLRTDGAEGIYDEPGRAGRDYLRADVAALVYSAADGADHKAHRAAVTQAIYEWLEQGDDGYGREIADLAAEWSEHPGA